MQWSIHTDVHALAGALADELADKLAQRLAVAGKASMAVSGGNTPKRLFRQLSRHALAWDKIAITLVDERWVPPHAARSNARLVADHLLQQHAAHARFMPLYVDGVTADAAVNAITAQLQGMHPFDVVILGMGNDGHTASFFPDADNLQQLLDMRQSHAALPVHAPSAGEPRMTLTLPTLASARYAYLHIEGANKRAVLETALRDRPDLPISVVAAHMPQLVTYWCP